MIVLVSIPGEPKYPQETTPSTYDAHVLPLALPDEKYHDTGGLEESKVWEPTAFWLADR